MIPDEQQTDYSEEQWMRQYKMPLSDKQREILDKYWPLPVTPPRIGSYDRREKGLTTGQRMWNKGTPSARIPREVEVTDEANEETDELG